MNKPRGIIFDLDGTIYCGGQLISGARETIEWMQSVRSHLSLSPTRLKR